MFVVGAITVLLLLALVVVLRMEPRARLKVWLVDDREANRTRFEENHAGSFDVRCFESPDAVLRSLRSGEEPDALLCDIYFYPDPGRREEVEQEVADHEETIKKWADGLGEGADRGIALIEAIADQNASRPLFPIYAYTSKGPYLLQGNGFDRLERVDARWLFKNKYAHQADTERYRITKDVQDLRRRQGWRQVREVVLATGLLSAILGAFLDWLVRTYFG